MTVNTEEKKLDDEAGKATNQQNSPGFWVGVSINFIFIIVGTALGALVPTFISYSASAPEIPPYKIIIEERSGDQCVGNKTDPVVEMHAHDLSADDIGSPISPQK